MTKQVCFGYVEGRSKGSRWKNKDTVAAPKKRQSPWVMSQQKQIVTTSCVVDRPQLI